MAELCNLDTGDGEMPTLLYRPAEAPRGGVVVIQEAFGVTDHIASIGDRLADAGYLAVVPALFHRLGSPAFAYDDFEHVMPAMGTLTADGLRADVTAAVGLLASEGIAPTARGMVGFCMGGTVTFLASTMGLLHAGVTFYGGGVTAGRFGLPSLLEMAPSLDAAWLGLYGDLDQGIPVDQVEALREATVNAEVPTQVVRYAEAEHGFNCSDRASFNAAASDDAWARTLAWFETYLTA